MQIKMLAIGVAAVLVVGIDRPLFGQSLADVARAEEARRKALRDPAKVLTNKDLLPPPVVSGQSPDPPKDGETVKAADGIVAIGDGSKTSTSTSKDAKDKDPNKDPAYWAGRLKALQMQLDQDQSFATALQSQINALTADFVARDDPAQKAVIERNRQKALADLTRVKSAVVADQKAIADLGEEARRAGVPPGWLR